MAKIFPLSIDLESVLFVKASVPERYYPYFKYESTYALVFCDIFVPFERMSPPTTMSADVRFKKLFRLQCFLDAEKVISTHQPQKVTKEYLIEYEFERIV